MQPNRVIPSFVPYLLAALPICFGQTTSDLSGTIKDSSGALVASAQIEITSVETGITRNAQSSDSGAYAFALLPPGAYRVTVRKTGFRAVTQENVRLEVN